MPENDNTEDINCIITAVRTQNIAQNLPYTHGLIVPITVIQLK